MSIRDEELRKKAEKRKKTKKVIYGIIVLGILLCFINLIAGLAIVIPLTLFVVLFQTANDIKHEGQDFEGKIVNELSPKIIKLALPDSERFVDEGIEKEEYIASEFIESCDGYRSWDKIVTPLMYKGDKVGEIAFADTSHEITDDAKDSFSGIFTSIPLTKDIRTKIKINREGKFPDGNIFKYEMPNTEFEKYYDLMAMNKHMLESIITDEILDKFVSIYHKYKWVVEINILRNKLYVRVVGSSKVVSRSGVSEIDRVAVDNYYNIMKETTELIEMIYKAVDEVEI